MGSTSEQRTKATCPFLVPFSPLIKWLFRIYSAIQWWQIKILRSCHALTFCCVLYAALTHGKAQLYLRTSRVQISPFSFMILGSALLRQSRGIKTCTFTWTQDQGRRLYCHTFTVYKKIHMQGSEGLTRIYSRVIGTHVQNKAKQMKGDTNQLSLWSF